MVTSYNGEVLRVNLTERTINVEPLDMEKAVKYIGGRGLGTRMPVSYTHLDVYKRQILFKASAFFYMFLWRFSFSFCLVFCNLIQ